MIFLGNATKYCRNILLALKKWLASVFHVNSPPSPPPPPLLPPASVGAAAARGPLADQFAEVAGGAVVKRGRPRRGGGPGYRTSVRPGFPAAIASPLPPQDPLVTRPTADSRALALPFPALWAGWGSFKAQRDTPGHNRGVRDWARPLFLWSRPSPPPPKNALHLPATSVIVLIISADFSWALAGFLLILGTISQKQIRQVTSLSSLPRFLSTHPLTHFVFSQHMCLSGHKGGDLSLSFSFPAVHRAQSRSSICFFFFFKGRMNEWVRLC